MEIQRNNQRWLNFKQKETPLDIKVINFATVRCLRIKAQNSLGGCTPYSHFTNNYTISRLALQYGWSAASIGNTFTHIGFNKQWIESKYCFAADRAKFEFQILKEFRAIGFDLF